MWRILFFYVCKLSSGLIFFSDLWSVHLSCRFLTVWKLWWFFSCSVKHREIDSYFILHPPHPKQQFMIPPKQCYLILWFTPTYKSKFSHVDGLVKLQNACCLWVSQKILLEFSEFLKIHPSWENMYLSISEAFHSPKHIGK